MGYTVVGEQVGMAQRMESVAPPGGVMLSESTARLVENAAVLGDPELVQIKGADHPVRARSCWHRRTQARTPQRIALVGRAVGTQHDDRDPRRGDRRRRLCRHRHGPPGIGKSRLIRETAAIAAGRGVAVFTTYCESHTRDIPFHAVARLLRAGRESTILTPAARAHIRDRIR